MLSRSLMLASGVLLTLLPFTASAIAADGVAVKTTTLRAGPDSSYPSVTSVRAGDDLQIYGCLSGFAWCDVSAVGYRGWLRGSRIEFLRDGTRLTISEGYSDFGLSVEVFALDDYWGNYYGDQTWFADRRWRRGAYALPSNWQQNRSAWVHPGNQPARSPQAATPNTVQHTAPGTTRPVQQDQTHATPNAQPNAPAHTNTTARPHNATHALANGPHNQAVTHAQRPQRTNVQPNHAMPQRAAPQRAAPQHAAPQRAAPQRAAPQRAAPPAEILKPKG